MKIVLPEDVKILDDKTNQEIADLMGDDLKEEIFVYVKETDQTTFM